jgi:hypothetical protein
MKGIEGKRLTYRPTNRKLSQGRSRHPFTGVSEAKKAKPGRRKRAAGTRSAV